VGFAPYSFLKRHKPIVCLCAFIYIHRLRGAQPGWRAPLNGSFCRIRISGYVNQRAGCRYCSYRQSAPVSVRPGCTSSPGRLQDGQIALTTAAGQSPGRPPALMPSTVAATSPSGCENIIGPGCRQQAFCEVVDCHDRSQPVSRRDWRIIG
jgi:hypothetical protein